jgi:tRNA1Val (adenine37-N6)-methyltransferase
MGNTTFTFKQFTVKQDQCAMKVSTDACVFGAWAVQRMLEQNVSSARILDIGTGTGLLSLMVAQQLKSGLITAIEIEEAAAKQARENFNNSPWGERISLIQGDIKQQEDKDSFDVIISNPPFFEGDLPANSTAKNQAFHDKSLTLAELLNASFKKLKATGCLYFILPAHRKNDLEFSCDLIGYTITACCSVKPSQNKSISRILIECKKKNEPNTTIIKNTSLVIQGESMGYSTDVHLLLKDYYLYL